MLDVSGAHNEREGEKLQWRDFKPAEKQCVEKNFNTNTPDVNTQVQTLERSQPSELVLLEQTQTHMHHAHTLHCEGGLQFQACHKENNLHAPFFSCCLLSCQSMTSHT